jgi:hypothetical protein
LRHWETEIHAKSGSGRNISAITSFKTYSLKEAGEVMRNQRAADAAAGLPKRKVNPITTYLLEELIQMYFRDYAPRGDTLEKIMIEDQK